MSEEATDQTFKPLSDLLTLTTASEEDVRQAVKRGFVPKPEKGKYHLSRAVVGMVKYFKAQSAEAGALPVYDSMGQCAARSHVPLSVQKSAKRAGCPAFKWNRVALGPLLEWIFSKGEDAENWPTRLKRAEALIKEIALEKAKDETLDKADIHFAVSKATNLLFNELDRAANVELPPLLRGLDALDIQRALLLSNKKVKENFISGLAAFGSMKE